LAGCESEQSVWSAKPTSITQVYEMGASNNAQVNLTQENCKCSSLLPIFL